ncbi:MAG: glucose-1-phosphate adenylyltransferase [Immundisolibacter sp.]
MNAASRPERFISELTRDTLALILAGGRGSRLEQLTQWRAKPAVPFGGKFRIIDFPLSNCVNSGIRRIGVLTQYKAHSLILHIQRGWGHLSGQFGEFVELLPAQQRLETSWYAGTADAVWQNLDIIAAHDPGYVLILAGDHIYKMDYGPMLAAHVTQQADVTVGCLEVPVADARGFGVLAVDDDLRIRRFVEKPAEPPSIPGRDGVALCSMGIYVFNTGFLFEQLYKDADEAQSKHDFGHNVIPALIGRHRAYAYPFVDPHTGGQAYWRDVGTLDAYYAANMDLVSVTPELNLYDTDWPIWTLQEQVPPAKFVFDDDGRRGMAVDSVVSGGCIVSGATLRRSLLFTNVRVEAGAQVEESVVLPQVRIGEGCRIRRAIIERGCVIPPGTVIGHDTQADARRFKVTPNGVTLVIPEMLGQALHHAR